MEQFLSELSIKTPGEGFTDITHDINKWIQEKKMKKGILVITSKHTSCSLIINENADPKVLEDLSRYIKAIVPEIGFKSILNNANMQKYLHSQEGVDDMPAHIRTTLTSTSLTLSINQSKLDLGTWQAIYLWEHRYSKNIRKLNLHSIGETDKVEVKKNSESFNTVLTKNNPTKLNKIVLENSGAMSSCDEEDSNTKTDLLIDRIHDLTSRNE